MNLSGKKALVAGTGISGIAAAKLLMDDDVAVILYDENEQLSTEDVRSRFGNLAPEEMIFGPFLNARAEEIGLAVLSPGIPTDQPFVQGLRAAGVPIWGEIELAAHYARGQMVAITGTNGKTTTTALVGEIMRHYFDSVFVVGNIGVPYTQMAPETTDQSVTVAEISSFQLETVVDFHPHVSAILNITPDHLNRHYTMENYANAKFSIAKNQTLADVCVLNYDNELTRAFGERCPARVVYFSRTQKLERGIYLADDNDTILQCEAGREIPVCQMSRSNLLGAHNVENVMAAVGMALAMNVPPDVIAEAVSCFQAVEHRIEFVREIGGVAYYNDSKGTNTDAAIKGIEAMVRPTVLIAGGYDKHSTYDEWLAACEGKVKALLLIGQTAPAIAKAAKAYRFPKVEILESLREAVNQAALCAQQGDAVLLSPACASWGMFKNYEERGTLFKEYVNGLRE